MTTLFQDMFYCLFTPVMMNDVFYYDLTAPKEAEDGWGRFLSGMVNTPADISIPSFESVHCLDRKRYQFQEKSLQAHNIMYETTEGETSSDHGVEITFDLMQNKYHQGSFHIHLAFKNGLLQHMSMQDMELKKAA